MNADSQLQEVQACKKIQQKIYFLFIFVVLDCKCFCLIGFISEKSAIISSYEQRKVNLALFKFDHAYLSNNWHRPI